MPTIKCYDKYGNEIDHLTQWDINVTLKILDYPYDIAPICHFTKRYDKEALTVTSTLSDGVVSVIVPNRLLGDENPKANPIKMYVFLYSSDENSGRTVFVVDLPVETKPRPNDYEYEDNDEVILIGELKVKLEGLVAQANEVVTVRIGELETTYNDTITKIKQGIADDVNNLNRQITNANTHLISEIRDNNTRLSNDIHNNLITILNGIQSGSPKGVFATVDDLQNQPEGLYLLANPESEDNGWVFYWNGTELSPKVVYYAGLVINHDTITYDMFTDSLKKQTVEKIISYTLIAEDWDESAQEIDISESYEVTPHTKADIDLSVAAFNHLVDVGCMGIYVATNENDDNRLIAHVLGGVPTEDITIQLTLRETV